MTTYSFSSLAPDSSFAFDPATDVLQFDSPLVSASTVFLLPIPFPGPDVFVVAMGKTVVLLGVTIDQLSATNVTFADGSVLLVGDTLHTTASDAAANLIVGGAGADQLIGFGGDDTLIGGGNDDLLDVSQSGNVSVDAGGGNDFIYVGAEFTSADSINGGDGQDIVSLQGDYTGGLTLSATTLVDVEALWMFLAGGDTSVTTDDANVGSGNTLALQVFALPDTRLHFDGSAETDGHFSVIGSAGSDSIVGGANADTLVGGGGSDTLDGGAGADSLVGGLGDDTYLVDDSADVIVENAFEGTDQVFSSASYVLSPNVENLTLVGSSDIDGVGNSAANLLTGNSGGNLLDGQSGDDTLEGGLGDDTLVGGAGLDVAKYSGVASDYIIETIDGLVRVTDLNTADGDDGSDTLRGIDTLRFTSSDLILADAPVNTTTLAEQTRPAVAALAGGGYVVTWTSDGQDGSTLGIYAQRFASDGTRIGEETQVNTTTAVEQQEQAIAGLADGGYVITWHSFAGGNLFAGIFAQRYDSQGAKVGGEVKIASATVFDHTAVGALPDGGYVVSWKSNGGIYAREYATDGTPVAAEFRVDSTLAGADAQPVLTALADGGFVVAWSSSVNSSIYAQRYDAGGAAVGSEVQVSASPFAKDAPSITALNDGGYVVAWQSVNQDGQFFGIYSQRYDAGGVPIGTEQQVNTSTNGAQKFPSVGALADGGYVIAWESNHEDLKGAYFQRYGADGTPIGGETAVKVGPLSPELHVNVLGLPDGGFLITLGTQFISSPSLSDIYSYRYDADGQQIVGEVGILGTTGGDVINAGQGPQYLSGLEGADNLSAGAGNDVLSGGPGADTLDGGSGNDTMVGGTEDDLYLVDSASDVVREVSSGGIDLVRSTASYVLPAQVENLELTGTGNINGTGNALNNLILGNSGNNVLDGGAGIDTMSGGAGNDTYVIDSLSDVISEAPGAGVDLVMSPVSYVLGPTFENLTLLGANNSTGTGNDLANILIGNNGNNVLDGGLGNDILDGGPGADTLLGGAGDDLYYVDTNTDVITEGSNKGIDSVVASGSYTLGDNVEILTLVGNGDINGTGNKIGNLIIGNSGYNILDGDKGADTLYGAEGSDTVMGGAGEDFVSGGAGNDTLIGGASADNFGWMQGDQGTFALPAVDTVMDFGGGDALNLQDLLVGEHRGAHNSAGDLAGFLHFSYDAANARTILEIRAGGGFSNQSTSGMTGGADQVVYLNGVNLVGNKASQDAVIANLLPDRLVTD